MWRVFPPIPVGMEFASKFIKIIGDAVRLMGAGRKFHKPRIERKPFHQSELTRIFEALERGGGQPGGALPGVDRQARYDFPRIAQHRLAPCMRILDIKDRIVAGPLDDFEKIKLKKSTL